MIVYKGHDIEKRDNEAYCQLYEHAGFGPHVVYDALHGLHWMELPNSVASFLRHSLASNCWYELFLQRNRGKIISHAK